MFIDNDSNVQSFYFNDEENKIEVVFRKSSGAMYASNPPRPVPDTVWKEVYGVVGGKITLLEKVDGKHIPGEYVEESIKFDK